MNAQQTMATAESVLKLADMLVDIVNKARAAGQNGVSITELKEAWDGLDYAEASLDEAINQAGGGIDATGEN